MVEELSEAIVQTIESRLENVHTCLPGRIEKYDYTKQKANVKPLIKKLYRDGEVKELPVIVNVPVVFPRTGDAIIHFPLNKGDGVMLHFTERSMDTWLSKGGDAEPGDNHKFDLSDCIAIPGLYDFTQKSKAENNTDFAIIFKTGKVVINPNGKVAFGNGTGELVEMLHRLVETLITSTTATAIGPQPLSSAIAPTELPKLLADIKLIMGNLS